MVDVFHVRNALNSFNKRSVLFLGVEVFSDYFCLFSSCADKAKLHTWVGCSCLLYPWVETPEVNTQLKASTKQGEQSQKKTEVGYGPTSPCCRTLHQTNRFLSSSLHRFGHGTASWWSATNTRASDPSTLVGERKTSQSSKFWHLSRSVLPASFLTEALTLCQPPHCRATTPSPKPPLKQFRHFKWFWPKCTAFP